MRKIINSTYITADGVIKNPQDWPPLEPDETATTIQTDLLSQCDAVLLGKDTFLSFASVWQGQSGEPYTDRLNTMRKYVVSTTIHTSDWQNTEVLATDIAGAVARIKDQPGGDIVSYGFGRLGRTLVEHGLLDEIRLWVHPFFLGGTAADTLLFGNAPAARLSLVDSQLLKNGIAILNYSVQHGA
jgi:dihydrofolate reductase